MTQPNAEKRLSKLLVTNKLTPESLLDDLREIYDVRTTLHTTRRTSV